MTSVAISHHWSNTNELLPCQRRFRGAGRGMPQEGVKSSVQPVYAPHPVSEIGDDYPHVVVMLDARHRMIAADIQWIVQERRGNGSRPWYGQYYCRSKAGLLRFVRRSQRSWHCRIGFRHDPRTHGRIPSSSLAAGSSVMPRATTISSTSLPHSAAATGKTYSASFAMRFTCSALGDSPAPAD